MVRAVRRLLVGGVLVLAVIAPFAAGADSGSGTLPPSYPPRPPPAKPIYTTHYLFAITRAVADSTLVPAARVPLYALAIPVDVAFLPIELIAGFFPGD